MLRPRELEERVVDEAGGNRRSEIGGPEPDIPVPDSDSPFRGIAVPAIGFGNQDTVRTDPEPFLFVTVTERDRSYDGLWRDLIADRAQRRKPELAATFLNREATPVGILPKEFWRGGGHRVFTRPHGRVFMACYACRIPARRIWKTALPLNWICGQSSVTPELTTVCGVRRITMPSAEVMRSAVAMLSPPWQS